MDQILKNSDPTANEIRVSQNQLLSQMQNSNMRFQTSKVINQQTYEEAVNEKKGLKSSLKKGPGRFGRTPEKESQKVMFKQNDLQKQPKSKNQKIGFISKN